MSSPLDYIRILLRALPYLQEIVFPVAGMLALGAGIFAGRLMRRLRQRPAQPLGLRRFFHQVRGRSRTMAIRSSPFRRSHAASRQ